MGSDAGWLLREAPAPRDVTARFLQLYEDPPLPALPVLLVGGIFTDLYPGYLRAVRRGLRATEIDIDSQGTVEKNARAIRDAVTREVVLLGQSKGPLDIHAALALYPELRKRVRAFVSLQAPFAGTPLADDPARIPLARRLAPEGFLEMSYARRRKFLREHDPVPPVPTVALATSCARAGLFLEKARQHLADEHGVASDGFVPFPDAQIPGARLVHLTGVDHAALALRWLRPRGRWRPGRVARALVALALEDA